MSWHRIIITNPAMAQTAIDTLRQQWRAVYQAAGRPADAAVYRDHQRCRCGVVFSPDCVKTGQGHSVGLWRNRLPTTTKPLLLWRKWSAEVHVKRWQAKEDMMAQAIVVILKEHNTQQLFQNAIAETADNQLRIYRQADPRGLAERQLVTEFDLDAVQTWFAMADAHR